MIAVATEPTVAYLGSAKISRDVDGGSAANGGLTYQARSRGMASIWVNGFGKWGRINLYKVREALDALTLDEQEFAYFQLVNDFNLWTSEQNVCRSRVKMTLLDGDRVKVLAPCGETRIYKVSTLDRVLTRLGF